MRAAVLTVIVWSCAVIASAQAAPQQAERPPAAAPAPSPAKSPEAPESFTYESGGRRDPFLNLIGVGTDPGLTSKRGEGPAGMRVAEISVKGIVQSRSALLAMVQGPDKKTYLVHQGDKFLDGTIKTITPQGLIIVQEVNDPLSLVKQREIRKQLRSLEDVKQ